MSDASYKSIFRLILDFTGDLAKAAKVAPGLAEILPEKLLNVLLRPALAGDDLGMLGAHHDHRAVEDSFLGYLSYRSCIRHRVRNSEKKLLWDL